MSEPKTVICSVCYGGGQRKGGACPACKGSGRIAVAPSPVPHPDWCLCADCVARMRQSTGIAPENGEGE